MISGFAHARVLCFIYPIRLDQPKNGGAWVDGLGFCAISGGEHEFGLSAGKIKLCSSKAAEVDTFGFWVA
jgi:hypothetical protein